MKILLLQDVYNLGRAGDVKKVANGYGRNYLIPQGLAVLATEGALKQADRIREDANKRRAVLNEEMATVAEQIKEIQLFFPARAGETGKLYGSVTTLLIAKELSEKLGIEINKRQIVSEPLRLLGMHGVAVRLTIDLIPEVSVVVFREGESPENYMIAAEELSAEAQPEDEQLPVEEPVIEEGAYFAPTPDVEEEPETEEPNEPAATEVDEQTTEEEL